MTERRYNGFENKGPIVDHTSAKYYPAPAPSNYAYDHVSACACANEDHGVRKDHLGLEDFSGYIFMCNGRTKPECYLYRVFGLPAGRREVIERIRPGTKLFLFDYDVKFLYGVYEATTAGKMNLEIMAFGGSFPAQVRFRIDKECLPLPESDFKHAILDNYQKGSKKFNPILNCQQASHLLSLFHTLTTQSPVKYDKSYIKDQYPRLPPSGTTYYNSTRLSQAPQVLVPQYVPQAVLVSSGMVVDPQETRVFSIMHTNLLCQMQVHNQQCQLNLWRNSFSPQQPCLPWRIQMHLRYMAVLLHQCWSLSLSIFNRVSYTNSLLAMDTCHTWATFILLCNRKLCQLQIRHIILHKWRTVTRLTYLPHKHPHHMKAITGKRPHMMKFLLINKRAWDMGTISYL